MADTADEVLKGSLCVTHEQWCSTEGDRKTVV